MSEVLKLTSMENFIRWHVWTMERLCQLCEDQTATTGNFIEKVSVVIDLKVVSLHLVYDSIHGFDSGNEDEAD